MKKNWLIIIVKMQQHLALMNFFKYFGIYAQMLIKYQRLFINHFVNHFIILILFQENKAKILNEEKIARRKKDLETQQLYATIRKMFNSNQESELFNLLQLI